MHVVVSSGLAVPTPPLRAFVEGLMCGRLRTTQAAFEALQELWQFRYKVIWTRLFERHATTNIMVLLGRRWTTWFYTRCCR